MTNMSWHIIVVLCFFVVIAFFYLIIALYSFWVKLQNWLRIVTWVSLILYSAFQIFSFFVKNNTPLIFASMVFVIIHLILWIYILFDKKAPKRLKILIWVVACIFVVISIVLCFTVPAMYGPDAMNMWINGL